MRKFLSFLFGGNFTEITRSDFGKNVDCYELKNSAGTAVKIITYGARVASWKFRGIEVVLGYKNLSDYEADDTYKGAIVGRCANRIGGAKFELGGKVFEIDKNDAGKNHLHGGFNGFEKKIFAAEITPEGLKLTAESPDGEGDILNHKIQIFADSYTWANDESVPDGRILPVENTPMDLRQPTKIGEHIDDDFDELNFGRGYDHNYCIGKLGEMKKAAYAESSDGKIKLTVETEMPGVQFYAGNWLNDKKFGKRTGFALESQFYPNAINLPNFDKPILKAGEIFKSKTIYTLS